MLALSVRFASSCPPSVAYATSPSGRRESFPKGELFCKKINFPERINTEVVEVVDATHLKMRVWERGSGETWACGTGTCATVAALVEQGLCPVGEDVHVALRGGELTIRVLPGKQLLMTGAATTVYEGIAEV